MASMKINKRGAWGVGHGITTHWVFCFVFPGRELAHGSICRIFTLRKGNDGKKEERKKKKKKSANFFAYLVTTLLGLLAQTHITGAPRFTYL